MQPGKDCWNLGEAAASGDRRQRPLVLLIVGLMAAVIGFGSWVQAATQPWKGCKIPMGFTKPVVALQFVQSPEEVKQLVGQETGSPARTQVRESLRRDTWYFIPVYGLFLASLGFLLLTGKRWLWRALGGLVMLLALGAATCDEVENWKTRLVLAADDADMAAHLVWMGRAASFKWGHLFLATALLGVVPWARPGPFDLAGAAPWVTAVARAIVSVLCVAAGTGLAFWIHPPWVETGAAAMTVAWFTLSLFLAAGLFIRLVAWVRLRHRPAARRCQAEEL